MTGHLRRLLQKRFGDGGHGFIAAGRPWRSFRHSDIEGGESGVWDAYRVRHPRGRAPEEEDRLLGLAGLAVESERRGSAVWVKTSNRGPVGHTASRFEVFYMTQPRGGRMEVSLDGTTLARLSTRAPEWTAVYYVTETMDAPHELRIEATGGGLVRLFGIVVEREGPGVVLDSLGLNGARVMTLLTWDQEILVEHLAQRNADLLVLWYGTNEVGDDWYSMERYEQWVIDAITVVRRAAPGASCLFVAPPDMGRASLSEDVEELATPRGLIDVMAAQRDAAELTGCAHWSTYEAMGGRDAIATWADHTPALAARDGIHLTRPGYELLGELLYAALIDGYEQYLERNAAQ
jgi:lysophospholipase L1-like esterase